MVDKKKVVLRELLILFVYAVLVFSLSLGALFVEGGATLDSELVKNTFYSPLFIIGFLVIFGYQLIKVLGNLEVLEGINIHQPEESPLKGIAKFLTVKNSIFLSLILFGIIGLLGTFQNVFFAQTPIEQQITNTGKVLLSSFPSAGAETLFFIAIMFTLILGLNILQKSLKFQDDLKNLMKYILIPIIIGIFWVGLHTLRYGASDLNLIIVFLFGFFGALLTVLTGSIIFWIIWHDLNNIFFTLNRLYADQRILIATVIILVVIIVFWVISGTKGKKE